MNISDITKLPAPIFYNIELVMTPGFAPPLWRCSVTEMNRNGNVFESMEKLPQIPGVFLLKNCYSYLDINIVINYISKLSITMYFISLNINKSFRITGKREKDTSQ